MKTINKKTAALPALCLLSASIWAQEKIPVINPAPTGEPVKRLEVEQVEIYGRFGIPKRIHRPRGEFLLILDNETGDRSAAFVLDPGDAGEGVLSPARLLLYDAKTPEVKHRKAGLVDLEKGTYYVKSVDKGHILCTVVIE